MPILMKIEGDMKEAMKARNAAALSTLRMLKSALVKRELEKGSALSDDDAIAVLRTYVKQQEEAKESFEKGGRSELLAEAVAEIELVKQYLPTMMSEEETQVIVAAKIAELGATSVKEMGKVVGAVMKAAEGKADGAIVSKIVKEKLGGS